MGSPLHARCHEFTHFLSLPTTRQKKATFFPLFRFARGDAASRPHPGMSLSLSLRVPALLSPRFPLCPNPLTHRCLLAPVQSLARGSPGSRRSCSPCGAAIDRGRFSSRSAHPTSAQRQHRHNPALTSLEQPFNDPASVWISVSQEGKRCPGCLPGCSLPLLVPALLPAPVSMPRVMHGAIPSAGSGNPL